MSHKRKHERREIEFTYRQFKQGTGNKVMINPMLANFASATQTNEGQGRSVGQGPMYSEYSQLYNNSEYSNLSDSSMKDPDSPYQHSVDDADADEEVPGGRLAQSYNSDFKRHSEDRLDVNMKEGLSKSLALPKKRNFNEEQCFGNNNNLPKKDVSYFLYFTKFKYFQSAMLLINAILAKHHPCTGADLYFMGP
jgi:hypothetical protein